MLAVCHRDETDPALEEIVDEAIWIKVGELGKLISSFTKRGISQVAMAGGINRVNHFGDVKLDLRGATVLAKLRELKAAQ